MDIFARENLSSIKLICASFIDQFVHPAGGKESEWGVSLFYPAVSINL